MAIMMMDTYQLKIISSMVDECLMVHMLWQCASGPHAG